MSKRDYTPIINKKFGRWTVVDVVRDGRYTKAICNCDCGTTGKLVRVGTLDSGESMSCGCLAAEKTSERTRTHGYSKHPLFQAHYDMLRRCYDDKRKDFHHYGGRGIQVCDRWKEPGGLGFGNFLEDSKNFSGEGTEIDRIDVNGDYCPENCKWATRKEQTRNTRFNHVVEFQGESKCLAEWSEIIGTPYKILLDRLGKLGWSPERAFTAAIKPRQIYVVNSENKFELKEVFKAPPNHFYRARVLGIPAYQYFANLFKNTFAVKILVAGELHEIVPNSVEVDPVNLNLTDDFENYCKQNSINIGQPVESVV